MAGVFASHALDMLGRPLALAEFGGRTTILVNSASMCVFAPRNMELIRNLQQHYSQTAPGKLQVLLFPSTDFGHQERMREEEILAWAGREYHVDVFGVNVKTGVTANMASSNSGCPVFLFGRSHVKTVGTNWTAPAIYEMCAASCGPPSWNWTKYIVSAGGVPLTKLGHADVSFNAVKPPIDSALTQDWGGKY